MTMTNEQLSEAVKELEQCFSAWDSGVRVVGNVEAGVALQVIRQLWAEREQQRAVMAQAKPVEVWELMDTIQLHAYTRDVAQAILSRYNVTLKESV